MDLKTIKIPNLGGKLNCQSFIHISKPVPGIVTDSMVPRPFMVMNSDDQDHQFQVELVDLVSYRVDEIPNFYAMLSHQVDSKTLKHQLMDSYKMLPEDKITVFLYQKNK